MASERPETGPGMVVHTCNSKYSGDRKIVVQGKQKQNNQQDLISKNKLSVWNTSIITATKEVKVGELWCPRKKHISFLKNN
jgi:hypothetical protein